MKRKDINTIDNLKTFIEEWEKENPDRLEDTCNVVRSICQQNNWVYTQDSEIEYDDEDFATDGDYILSLVSIGWHVFENNGQDIKYNGTWITIREDGKNYYVDFNTGLGPGIYPKADWTLKRLSKIKLIFIKKINR